MLQPIIFPVNGLRFLGGGGFHPMSAMLPQPSAPLLIRGVTRDSAGAVLGGCVVSLYRTLDDQLMERSISDPTTGAYSFSAIGLSEAYYVVAYKAGTPDVTGATVNSLVGV